MFSIFIKLLNKLKEDKNSHIVVSGILLWIANMILSLGNTSYHHENALLITMIWILAINKDKEILK